MRRLLPLLALALVAGCGGTTAAPETAGDPTPEPTSAASAPASVAGTVLGSGSCPATAAPFEPTSVTFPGVARDLEVVTPPRSSETVPGTPSTSSAGKQQVAYDREQDVQPGDPRGNVLLNAHTWPDGSALGNRLLDGLDVGDRIVLRGDADARLCYRVTDRVEVDAAAAFTRYYETDGPAQVAIVVCSGERLGPGVWTRRTVWFASPSA